MLLAVSDDLVEAFARQVEASLTQVHDTLVQLTNDARGELLLGLKAGCRPLSSLRHLDRAELALNALYKLSITFLMI